MCGAEAARPVLLPGHRVGDWTVTGHIGDGSWGSVYAAEHIADRSAAAVKLLRTDLLTPAQRVSMDDLMRREVRFSLMAEHPNVVRTRAVLTLDDPDRPHLDGITALVMDRAERSLQDLLDDAPAGAPVPHAPQLLVGISAGLAHIHSRGWVHGDLKPANILLARDGRVWLADFGLSAELEGTHAYVPPLGSLDHVPPEWWSQRSSLRGAPLRPSADIWAFGVVAHQVLTGGLHPFPGGTARARGMAAGTYARGGARLRLDDAVPLRWRGLITDCLRPDHRSRALLSARDVSRRVRSLAATPAARRPWGRAVPRTAGSLRLVTAACVVTLLSGDIPTGQDSRTPQGSAPASTVRTFQNMSTKACMDDSSEFGLRGYACNGLDFQRWRIRNSDGTAQQIQNVDTGKCLYDDGVVLDTRPCDSSLPRSWVVLTNGGAPDTVRSRATGKCLHDGEYGLQTLPCKPEDIHQQWRQRARPDA